MLSERAGNIVLAVICIFLLIFFAVIGVAAQSFGLFLFFASMLGVCVLIGIAANSREQRLAADRSAAAHDRALRRQAHLASLSPEDRQAHLLQEILDEQRAAAVRREELVRLGAAAFIWNKMHDGP